MTTEEIVSQVMDSVVNLRISAIEGQDIILKAVQRMVLDAKVEETISAVENTCAYLTRLGWQKKDLFYFSMVLEERIATLKAERKELG